MAGFNTDEITQAYSREPFTHVPLVPNLHGLFFTWEHTMRLSSLYSQYLIVLAHKW
jgi:hypothetical protein